MIYTAVVLVALFVFLFNSKNNNFRKVYIFFKTLRRDLSLVHKLLSLVIHVRIYKQREDTVPKLFTKLASKHPRRTVIYFEDETWTFQEVENLSNKIANFFSSQGYLRGDVVALFMENRPEYVCVWLGLSKIGVVTALVNSNLVGDPLVHSIATVEPKCIVYGPALKEVVNNTAISDIKLYELCGRGEKPQPLDGAENLNVKLDDQSDRSPSEDLRKGRLRDKLLYIYTSGTTGLPKAAIISNARFLMVAAGLPKMTKLSHDDVLYNCLPLYHSTGAMLGLSHCLVTGGAIAIRKKFSVTNFWKDCSKYGCTAALYIGEICRYMLSHHSNDKTPIHHPVTKFIGSGLRPQIWKQFVSKFNIKHVFEIYGSTEGNANMMNLDNTPGAVGYFPLWLSFVHSMCLIRCNMETAEPIRGTDGFYQPCQPGEPGLFVAKVSFNKILGQFLGYVNKEASEKKILRNVFEPGDAFFNSGDILVRDELGYFYFRDRTGDTFRWKGENVATSEVEAVISNILNLEDAVVYGVEVPGTEGRAGMAAVVDSTKALDLKKFAQDLKNSLPSYSIPLFLRIIESVELTSTFKLKKTTLRQEGFDVGKVRDRLFMLDAKNVTYVELTNDLYNDIMTGNVRLNLLRNVFKAGDAYFNSGDILVQDDAGYFYFRDRTGDTFRWKCENVSTTEVEAVISKLLNLDDAAVHGVELPGIGGKAGMVALVDRTHSLDLKKFYQERERVTQHLPFTGTFRLQKVNLKKENYNVDKITDKLFVYDVDCGRADLRSIN